MFNHQKSLVSLILIAASASLFASGPLSSGMNGSSAGHAAAASPRHKAVPVGFYVAGRIGWFGTEASAKGTVTTPTTPFTFNMKLNLSSLFGSLNLGYGRRFNNLYLGGDAFATLHPRKDSISLTVKSGALHNTFQSRYGLGVDLMPGYFIASNLLTYVKLGYVNSEFKSNGNFGNNTKHLSGFQLGTGFKYALSDHWAMSTESIVDFYQDWNINAVKIKNYSFNLSGGLNYQFGG